MTAVGDFPISSGRPSRTVRVYGVDFSGAAQAWRKIWVAEGTCTGDRLQIDRCRRLDAIVDPGRARVDSFGALRQHILASGPAVWGMDFPFSLPAPLVKEETWEEFVLAFPSRYPTAFDFQRLCWEAAGARELRRETDVASRTPFSPYNLRLYRQTYFGIRDVLRPLVADRRARVPPMQSRRADLPAIVEVCPASTLKRLALTLSYKGRTAAHRSARERILRELARLGGLSVSPEGTWAAVADAEGDALDSIVAALAASRVPPDSATLAASNPLAPLEGYVYA